ncbi:MAG: ATP-binding cassette domain-containing protein, partial [Muribaculaceae bacterium]|nr:ATP-binding cassette domain-containing protein [Muribaculaceae bacterium]
RPQHQAIRRHRQIVIRDRIIRDENWEIHKGDCWALTGKNGSGKSLLLSMVCADNPQGYANDIVLFDRKRGSGESIWEIKDAIGYVSPEMQLFFKSGSNVREIVMQGLRNSLNRYRKPSSEELEVADRWLSLLSISHLADRLFSNLSTGEQRLVLVARAMIKQPELLVLDEPLHGLDPKNKNIVKTLVDGMLRRNGTTLIYVTHYNSEIPSCVRFSHNLEKR